MSNATREPSIVDLKPDDQLARLIEDQWPREAERKGRLEQLRATPRTPQHVREKTEARINALLTASNLEHGSRQAEAVVPPRHVYPLLIVGAIAGVWWLLAHGFVLLGFLVAGIALGVAAYRSDPQSPRGPLSKEEELASWGVRWEVNDPVPDGVLSTVQHAKSFMRQRKRKGRS